jgi:hypothetical protein
MHVLAFPVILSGKVIASRHKLSNFDAVHKLYDKGHGLLLFTSILKLSLPLPTPQVHVED